MTNCYAFRLLVCLVLLASPLLAQKATVATKARSSYEEFAFRQRQIKGAPIICYGLQQNAFTSQAAPSGFGDGRARRAATAQFIVDYVGYPDNARAAFQRAVDIWSTLISSPVPIRIKAYWRPLGGTTGSFITLGSAGPADYFIGSDGTQKALTRYPIALAEKIARRALNHPDSADIVANFNSQNSWYLGLDARPTAGTSDLVTVVLHELGHGLGFTGGIRGNTATQQASRTPFIFDNFIESSTGAKLANPTAFSTATALYSQLVSNNLYINGPVLTQKTGGRAQLYAPATYENGSSVYHLNEQTYPAGTPNSLMTPNLSNAEAIHNPGPITLAIFEDMEWKTTSLLHDPIPDTESPNPIVVTARVVSDTTLGSAPPILYYQQGLPTQGNVSFRGVNMVRVGTTDTYQYTIPASELAAGRISYYITVRDGANRLYTNPGRDINNAQDYHTFDTGIDRVPPRIKYVQNQTSRLAAETGPINILASITDNRKLGTLLKQGIDTAYVELQVNGQARPSIPLTFIGYGAYQGDVSVSSVADSIWYGPLVFPQGFLKAGDKISYRIVTRDLASTRNQTISPASGFYEISVAAPQTTVLGQYVNSFTATNAAADFAANNFRIETPSGFTKPSINSDHPYKNGAITLTTTGAAYESDYTYTLLAPIRVKANPDSAKIRFNEIVLVEPSDDRASYGGEGFYDYVIVEASKDNGRTWDPLIDGYNATNRQEWLTAYNSRLTTSDPNTGERNSTAVGTPSLLRNREIGIYDKGFFRANDVILIRFRLFADQLAHGWGWQIDNLQIQTPPPPPILATEPLATVNFQVYPNPVSNTVRITAELAQPAPADRGTLTLSSPNGQALRQVPVAILNGRKINEQMDLSQLPAGMYFLQLKAGDASQIKKIVVSH